MMDRVILNESKGCCGATVLLADGLRTPYSSHIQLNAKRVLGGELVSPYFIHR